MSLSMYDVSIPMFLRGLGNLSALLQKGQDYAAAEGIDPAEMTGARLAPDMLPLNRQVHLGSDAAKACAARLTASDIPSFPDTETSFAELQQRIAKTVTYLKSFDRQAFDGSEARTITLSVAKQSVSLDGQSYLLNFVLPNFFFHVTTSYAILRHKGVPIGKMDYLGAI